jgi:hypothetical protein
VRGGGHRIRVSSCRRARLRGLAARLRGRTDEAGFAATFESVLRLPRREALRLSRDASGRPARRA